MIRQNLNTSPTLPLSDVLVCLRSKLCITGSYQIKILTGFASMAVQILVLILVCWTKVYFLGLIRTDCFKHYMILIFPWSFAGVGGD